MGLKLLSQPEVMAAVKVAHVDVQPLPLDGHPHSHGEDASDSGNVDVFM